MENLQHFITRINRVVKIRGWEKDWSNGGCYLHLESSEFIESLRGKGDSPPAEEAADVLFALFALIGNYNVPISEVLRYLDIKITEKEQPDVSSNT